MRSRRYVTPGEFWQLVQRRAYEKYLQRKRRGREEGWAYPKSQICDEPGTDLSKHDWFAARWELLSEVWVVEPHPARVNVAAYFLMLDRQRGGTPGTQDGDWLKAEERLARLHIDTVLQPVSLAA